MLALGLKSQMHVHPCCSTALWQLCHFYSGEPRIIHSFSRHEAAARHEIAEPDGQPGMSLPNVALSEGGPAAVGSSDCRTSTSRPWPASPTIKMVTWWSSSSSSPRSCGAHLAAPGRYRPAPRGHPRSSVWCRSGRA